MKTKIRDFKKYFDTVLRVALGLFLIQNSVIGILTPLESLGLPPDIHAFINGLWNTGYLMHLVKLIELLCGLSLITNLFVPLFLIAFVPVLVNIYCIHIFLFDSYVTSGLKMSLVVGYLLWKDRHVLKPFFVPRLRGGYVS